MVVLLSRTKIEILTTGVYSSVIYPNGENTLQRKMIRRTPSAPELAQSRKRPTIGVPRHPVARSDPRLDNATTERWGITFISDDTFRKVLTSYIVWDQPCWEIFDIDDFCEAVSGKTSELASKLLVMAVLAYGLVRTLAQQYYQ
jgi:hypothetical protein